MDETDSNTRTLLIVAYNQEAAAIADLEAHGKEQFLRSEAARTPATQVKDAERMTAMSSLQSEAASTLAEATSLSLLRSVDEQQPEREGYKADRMIPCVRRTPTLLKESTALARPDQRVPTRISASFFVKFLGGRKCK